CSVRNRPGRHANVGSITLRLRYRPDRTQERLGVALLHRREGATEHPFQLEVGSTAAVAGGPVEGELRGLDGPADVTLLRIETCPAGKLATPMGATRVDPVAGRAR